RPDEKQIFELRILPDCRDGNSLHLSRPVRPVGTAKPPRIPLAFDVHHCALSFLWETAFHEHEMAAQIDDFINVLIADRTLILTVPAGRAGPNFLLRHHSAD